MSIEDIRKSRNVPAKIGGRIRYHGDSKGRPIDGTIVGAEGGYLKIRLDGAKRAMTFHPTWKIEYLVDGEQLRTLL